jgi:hypothetical protein
MMPIGPDVNGVTEFVLDALGDYGHLLETRKSLLDLTANLRADRPGGANANIADIVAGMLEQKA